MRQALAVVLLLMLLLTAQTSIRAETFGDGLLFRVTGAEEAGGWLFGTIHAEDERVLALPEPVAQALDASYGFAMEVLPDADALLTSMVTMVLTDGRTLEDLVGENLYRRAVAAVKGIGLPEQAIREFKPWAVVTLLSVPPAKTGKILDISLYHRAKDQGKALGGLESIQEQLSVFDTLNEADQVTLLENTLDALDELPGIFSELIETYLRRDLAGLQRLSHQYLRSDELEIWRRFEERAVTARNHLMVERMLPLLVSGKVFVAIGALHLPGEEGVLNLLQRKGFHVEKVY